VAAFETEFLDVCARRLREPQPVQREQGDQRVVTGPGEPGRDEHGADLVAVQSGGVGLVVQPGAADVHGRGVVDKSLLLGVAVEAGDRARP
jgi:hypothetical protein